MSWAFTTIANHLIFCPADFKIRLKALSIVEFHNNLKLMLKTTPNHYLSWKCWHIFLPSIFLMKVASGFLAADRILWLHWVLWKMHFNELFFRENQESKAIIWSLHFLSLIIYKWKQRFLSNKGHCHLISDSIKTYSALQKNSFFWPFMKQNGVYSNWNKVS